MTTSTDMKCRGLQSSFAEAKIYYDYGKAIAKAKTAMSNGCDPCQGKIELMLLIQQLNLIRNATPKDWCYEGYCLGLFSPNRGRIDRYVNALEGELKIHKKDCKLHKRIVADRKYNEELNDLRMDKRTDAQAEEDRIIKLKQMELSSTEAINRAQLASDEKIKQMVLTSMEKMPHVQPIYGGGVADYIKDIFKK